MSCRGEEQPGCSEGSPGKLLRPWALQEVQASGAPGGRCVIGNQSLVAAAVASGCPRSDGRAHLSQRGWLLSSAPDQQRVPPPLDEVHSSREGVGASVSLTSRFLPWALDNTHLTPLPASMFLPLLYLSKSIVKILPSPSSCPVFFRME